MNTSTISTTTALAASTSVVCSTECFVDGATVDFVWYSAAVTQTVATQRVTISASNGTNYTTKSLEANTATVDVASLSLAVGLSGNGGIVSVINGTTAVIAPGTTMLVTYEN